MKTSEIISDFFEVEEAYVEDLLMGCDLLSDFGECVEDFNNDGDLVVISFVVEEPCESTILKRSNIINRDPWEDTDSYLTEEAIILQKSTGLKGKFFASYNKCTYKDNGEWFFSDNLNCNVKQITAY